MNFLQNEIDPAYLKDRVESYQMNKQFEHDAVLEQVDEVFDALGFYDADVQYSGFGSQGDGASFTGYGRYRKGSVAWVKDNYPKDKELLRIAKSLQVVHKRFMYQGKVCISRIGHRYSHENTIAVDGIMYLDDRQPNGDWYEDAEADMQEVVRDLCWWIYSRLNDEYDYQMSDEVCTDDLLEGYGVDHDGKTLTELPDPVLKLLTIRLQPKGPDMMTAKDFPETYEGMVWSTPSLYAIGSDGTEILVATTNWDKSIEVRDELGSEYGITVSSQAQPIGQAVLMMYALKARLEQALEAEDDSE